PCDNQPHNNLTGRSPVDLDVNDQKLDHHGEDPITERLDAPLAHGARLRLTDQRARLRTRKRPASIQATAMPSGTSSSSTGIAVVKARPGWSVGSCSPISSAIVSDSPAAASPARAATRATGAS